MNINDFYNIFYNLKINNTYIELTVKKYKHEETQKGYITCVEYITMDNLNKIDAFLNTIMIFEIKKNFLDILLSKKGIFIYIKNNKYGGPLIITKNTKIKKNNHKIILEL